VKLLNVVMGICHSLQAAIADDINRYHQKKCGRVTVISRILEGRAWPLIDNRKPTRSGQSSDQTAITRVMWLSEPPSLHALPHSPQCRACRKNSSTWALNSL